MSFLCKLACTDVCVRAVLTYPHLFIIRNRLINTHSYFTVSAHPVLTLPLLVFFCPCLAQLGDWVCEKMLMARDSSRDETQKLHKKWLKHQAFMAELAQNKEWLDKIEKVSPAT